MSYTLIIAEKPNAAAKISAALADKKPKLIQTEDKVKYYEFTRNGKKHIAVSAVGHLFSLKDDSGKGWNYPIFEYVWKPTFEINKRAAFSEKYLRKIVELADGADEYIVATDFDIEGSVIGYNIVRFACGQKDGKRMKFSTLTKQDLVDSYDGAMKHLDFPQIESGLARHELDFLWGVNVSRALTLAIKKGGKKLKFYLLTAGRVQTPMLYFLIKKENSIAAFKSKKFWQIEGSTQLDPKIKLPIIHIEDRFWDKPKADNAFSSSKGKNAIVDVVEKKTYNQKPPVPFDLTTLQTEAYRFFGWSPKQTTNVAQSLYEKGYISYPRTSSQKLPVQIGYKDILVELSNLKNYSKLCGKLLGLPELIPNEGKKVDAAHPAIYPTAETPKDVSRMAIQQKNLYDLIVRRFLSVFSTAAVKESVKVIFDIGPEKYVGVGRRTVEKGWTEFYGRFSKSDELILPDLSKDDKFKVSGLKLLNKETQPPPRYSQGSIVKEMETHSIGTKTTRASILQTLYDRGYIQGRSIEVTGLGMKVGTALAKYVPDIVSENMTREFEDSMKKIESGKKKRSSVIKSAKSALIKISKEFKSNEEKIGLDLEKAILETKDQQSKVGPCPNCKGELRVLFSPWTRKRFVGCMTYFRCAKCSFTKKACKCPCEKCGSFKGKCKCKWKEDKTYYPKCQTGFPIPLFGNLTALGKVCDKCNTPMIQVARIGKRPFRMCLDPNCETKKDWAKPKKGTTDVRKTGDKVKLSKPKKKSGADIYKTTRKKKIIRTRKRKKV